MQNHILKCQQCSNYTMKKQCPKCNNTAVISKPPKYSPDDKYSKYRRKVKKEMLVEKGLL